MGYWKDALECCAKRTRLVFFYPLKWTSWIDSWADSQIRKLMAKTIVIEPEAVTPAFEQPVDTPDEHEYTEEDSNVSCASPDLLSNIQKKSQQIEENADRMKELVDENFDPMDHN
jgi:hypothetical protein